MASGAMASGVLDQGRQRHLLQQAQALAAELRALPLDTNTTRQSYPRMFDLVRLTKAFVEATARMPADEAKAMWEQRGQWLQEEVAALAQERVFAADQQQQYLNLLLLLFAGAEACDRVLREKLELDAALQAAGKHAQDLQAQLQRAKTESEELLQPVADELLELKSKVAVLQQELDKQRSAAPEAAQQMQLLVSERDSLRQLVDELRAERQQLQEVAASRLEVIQQLMEGTESSNSRGETAVAEAARLQAHCKTLGINLETNAKVIEKLVELNSELMDALNAATAKNDMLKSHQQQQQQDGPQAAALAGRGPAALPPTQAVNGGADAARPWSATPSVQPQQAAGRNPVAAADAVAPAPYPSTAWAGGRGLMSSAAAAAGPSGPGPGPSLQQQQQQAAQHQRQETGAAATSSKPSPPSSSSSRPPAAAAGSLTDAFAAFLSDPEPPKRATADVLAMPAGAPAAGHGGGGGAGGAAAGKRSGGWGLMGALRYVAGGGPAGPPGHAGAGGGAVAPGAGAGANGMAQAGLVNSRHSGSSGSVRQQQQQ